MAITASPRLGITRWSAEADVQSRAQFDADHAALDLLAARDEQGTALARPAPAIRGRYYFATDTHELSRDDGATYWKVSLTDVQTDRSAGMSISTDGAAAAAGSGYSPLVISRNNSTAPYLTLNSTAASGPHWAVGIYGGSFAIGTGPSTSGTWATNPLLFLTTTGALSANGQSHNFGTFASSPTGTAINLGDRGAASSAYVAAKGDLASVGLILQGQGVAGSVSLQPNATNNVVVATPTSLTISQATAITAGGLDVTGSPTGYEAEVRAPITSPTSPTFALSTLATGSPSINMDHRGASNTGQWLWRNGTSAGTTRMTLTSAGHLVLTADVSTSLATGAVNGLALWGTGLVYQADGVAPQGGVTAGIALAINRAAPALTLTNGGGDIIQGYGDGYAQRFRIGHLGDAAHSTGSGGVASHAVTITSSPNTGFNSLFLSSNWGLGLGGDPFRIANSVNDLVKIDGYGRLSWPNASTNGLFAGTATAGAGGAIPGAPQGYLQVVINGTGYKIPCFNL